MQRPDQLWHLAALRAWHADELARLLDVNAEVVERLLNSVGIERDEAGRWRVSSADDARAVYDVHTMINQTFSMYHEGLADELGQRVAAWFADWRDSSLPGEDEEDEYWGVGAARRRLARDMGERSDLVHLRVFCATTKRPQLGLLADGSGTRVSAQQRDSTPRPWSHGVMVASDDSMVTLKIDLDDGDPGGLFAAEIAEFIDGLMISSDDRRSDIIRRPCATRMIAVVSFRADAEQAGIDASLAIAHMLAAVGEGLVHLDEPGEEDEKGFLLDGLVRTT